MPRMIRKQIYIEPEQDARLKRLAELLRVSQAELVRLAIGSFMNGRVPTDRKLDHGSWLKALEMMKSRPVVEGMAPRKRQSREELYDEMLSERGKRLP